MVADHHRDDERSGRVGTGEPAGDGNDNTSDRYRGRPFDPTVLAAATAENRLRITLDRGFGDVRAYPPRSHSGIVDAAA